MQPRKANVGLEAIRVSNQQELATELESHRVYLLRFATFLLHDASQAEDAVQDTFIAALTRHDGFEGRSQLRTWLISILKHKVVDVVRKRNRGPNVVSNAADGEHAHGDGAFSEEGKWVEPPAVWGLPEAAFESGQFWKTYLKCCELMPEKHALVFSMREVLGLSTEEICKNLDVTTSNLHVILYRARLSLRGCMTKNWFGAEHE